MPRTSSFTLHMNENKTLNASVNKNTTEDTTLYLVNAQCSVHYYKYKWNFINFSLSWSGKKSRCKLQCLVDGSVPQVMVDLINSFKQVKEISQINFDYISQKLASYFHQLCSSFKELPKMILNTQSNQVNLIYHHSKYRATFNSQSYKMLIWVTHRKICSECHLLPCRICFRICQYLRMSMRGYHTCEYCYMLERGMKTTASSIDTGGLWSDVKYDQ